MLTNEFHKNNVIVFDVESTGVDVIKDEITEIEAIKINKNGQVIEKFIGNKRFLLEDY